MPASPTEPDTTARLLDRIRAGDDAAVEELFSAHREYLHQVVGLRIDQQLSPRLDVSDIIQEAHLEAARRLQDFLHRRPMPFRLWLRRTAIECLLQQYRKHIRSRSRAVSQETPLPDRSSLLLARHVLAGADTPSQAAVKRELAQQVRQALAHLSDTDREILLMRTLEGLTNQETAVALNIDPDAARKRYTRALKRLRDTLRDSGPTESRS